jgi:AraC family transcriptional regulator
LSDRLEPGAFCGNLIRRWEVGGLLLTEHAYAPGLLIPRHLHEEPYFCLLLDGSYSETYGRRDRECGLLNLNYHPAGEEHSDRFHHAGGRIFHIEAGPRFWSMAAEHSLALSDPADFQGGAPSSLALRMHREFRDMDAVSPLILEGMALEMMGEVSRGSHRTAYHKPPVWLAQVLDLLRSQFTENLKLEEIARQVGVHPGHLVRVFREHRRCTIGEHVRQLRIRSACRMLSSSAASLCDIALSSGFADQAHFTRVFRRATGHTPAEYRRVFRDS